MIDLSLPAAKCGKSQTVTNALFPTTVIGLGAEMKGSCEDKCQCPI